ncbi:pre-mRNA-processing ATP-dependent RNA helicase Prp5p [[Candida] jaroonii]|uniref:Pre-mRNA-processing ATP-dependent RNA helicase Prp5p n=1 Tax=[Candida] jaroonii TaxID=467808 RepID=A0ACA9YFW6_9ASCO|nr:pre-mRNA-processing ATP-dependent RNA helicase Prp5p [[Candida] jaroonii]
MNATNEAEKLKKRQQQLAAWKLKKLDTSDDKKNDRLKRLEEWKKKRLKDEPKPKISLKVPINVKRKKEINSFVLEDEPVVKKPTFGKVVVEESDDEIDLDQFIDNLQSTSNTNVIEESDSEVEEDDNVQDDMVDRIRKLQEREKSVDVIDHSTIDYMEFRKNFYNPPFEFSKYSNDDIKTIRKDMEIQVRGDDVPIPITKWSQLGLSSSIMKVLTDLEYTPSPIQSQALPAIMSGRDVLGVAKTGSGKTLAFVLPLIRHVLDQPDISTGEGPIGLILTPTRELAIQINKELQRFSSLTSSCCYGGSNIESQINDIKRGVQVIVGTPGRVIDLLTVNNGRLMNLRRTTYLVIDEADRMYDMGFEPQVTKILSQIRPDKQMVLFSATFPKKLEILAKQSLQNPIEIVVSGISKVAKEITQKVELFEVEDIERKKFLKLTEILDEYKDRKVLIFVEKQDSADQLMVQLTSSDYSCMSIHGGKDQVDRKHAIKEFTNDLNILIATSIAARGLDVKGLDLVVNFDAPSHIEDYIHRVGRTGRAGRTGTAITFVSVKQERAITDLVKAMHETDEINPQLIEISEKFLLKVKQGKVKYSFGFGGHGLERLQQQRDRDEEMRLEREPSNKEPQDVEDSLPDFEIIDGKAPETSGPDISKYHSRITINDLPKQTRMFVTKNDFLSQTIEVTGVSITHKGQFYGPNQKPDKDKLYLLVEGLSKQSVNDANEMIKLRILEGLQNETQIGKYTI